MTITLAAVLGRGIVDPAAPVVCLDDVGLTRGDGCFEGCRIRLLPAGARVDHLDAHLARMGRSASALGIDFDPVAWRALVGELVDEWAATGDDEASMKLVATRGREGEETPTGFATVSPMPASALDARRDGIDVAVLTRGTAVDAFAGAPWLLGGVKTLSYAVNMAAQREADRRGAHDALFVTTDGHLLEAPTSSVVWLSGSTLVTVADGPNGILHSITTEALLDAARAAGLETAGGSGTVDDLHAADLVLLVGSVRGPVRVRSLDGVALRSTAAGVAMLATCWRLLDAG